MGGGRHRTPHGALALLVIASRPGRSFHFSPVGSEDEGEPKWPGAGTLSSLCLELSLHSSFPILFPLRLNNSIPLLNLLQAHILGLEAINYRLKNKVYLKILHSSLLLYVDIKQHP